MTGAYPSLTPQNENARPSRFSFTGPNLARILSLLRAEWSRAGEWRGTYGHLFAARGCCCFSASFAGPREPLFYRIEKRPKLRMQTGDVPPSFRWGGGVWVGCQRGKVLRAGQDLASRCCGVLERKMVRYGRQLNRSQCAVNRGMDLRAHIWKRLRRLCPVSGPSIFGDLRSNAFLNGFACDGHVMRDLRGSSWCRSSTSAT